MTMPALLDRIRRDATDAVADAADTAGSTASEVAEAIGSGLGSAASSVTDAAGTAGSAIADTTADAAGTLVDRIAELADAMRERLGEAVDDAGKAGRSTAKSAGGRMDDLRSVTARTSEDLAATLRDATARVTDGAPLDDVVRRLERRWPGTDEERYDRAYERGYARGRSGKLAVGLAVGAAAAAAGTFLLDPERGKGRRAAIQARARRLVLQTRRELETRGIRTPGRRDAGPPKLLPAIASPGAIGQIPSQQALAGTPADAGAGTPDPRVPVATGTVAAEGHEAEAERGSWHRDLPAG
jgi:gas vesicle protein